MIRPRPGIERVVRVDDPAVDREHYLCLDKNERVDDRAGIFFKTLLAVGLLACTFYLSFRASTPGSLKYGELHYFKMYWPCLAILASAYIDKLYAQANVIVKKRKA